MSNRETIEEAAENAWLDYEHEEGNLYFTTFRNGFKLGAQNQAETMYSEEEMQEYAEFCIRCYNEGLPLIVANDWRKQLKKTKQ